MDIIRKYYQNEGIPEPYVIKEAGKDYKLYPFVLATEDLDRQFEEIRLKPKSIKNFAKNAKMYLNHDSRALPIGEWKDIQIVDGKLKAGAWFHGIDEASQLIEKYVAAGQLKAASIGFQSLKRSEKIPDDKSQAEVVGSNTWSGKVIVHEEIDILEASIVGLPANPEALMGKDYKLPDDVINSLKSLEPGSPYEPNTTKAGAVLSKANKSKLEEALNKIQSVLDSATIEEPEKEMTDEMEELKIEVQNLKELVSQQDEIIADLRQAAEPKVLDIEEYLKSKI